MNFTGFIKVVKVVPLLKKKGDSLFADNYCSTSPLPWIWNVFEKGVYVQLSESFFLNYEGMKDNSDLEKSIPQNWQL